LKVLRAHFSAEHVDVVLRAGSRMPYPGLQFREYKVLTADLRAQHDARVREQPAKEAASLPSVEGR
jgi:hypothetical protein